MEELQKYQIKKNSNSDIYLQISDISINEELPNKLLFSNKSTNKNIIKKTRKIYKTKELYYSNGILGNLYNLNKCDYNFMLSFILFKKYNFLIQTSVKCFHIGFGKGGLIHGLEYFFNNGSASIYNIEWLGMRGDVSIDFAHNNLNNINYMDLSINTNLMYIQNMIDVKYNKIDILTNNIVPTYKNNKILISLAILSIKLLSSTGFLFTRIPLPDYWSGYMLHYLLLFSMIFNNTEIIRYPICRHKRVKYRYYLICYYKKRTLHESMIYRRLISVLEDVDINQLSFLQSITENIEINKWETKISKLQNVFINNLDNPQDELNLIINNVKDWHINNS